MPAKIQDPTAILFMPVWQQTLVFLGALLILVLFIFLGIRTGFLHKIVLLEDNDRKDEGEDA